MQCLPELGYRLHREIIQQSRYQLYQINTLTTINIFDIMPSENEWQDRAIDTGVSYAELKNFTTSREDMLLFCTHFCSNWQENTRMFYIRTTTDGKWKCVCYESGTDWPLTSSPYEWYWPTPEECPADTYKDTVSASDCTPCPNSTTNGYIGAYTIGICQPRAGYEWVGS